MNRIRRLGDELHVPNRLRPASYLILVGGCSRSGTTWIGRLFRSLGAEDLGESSSAVHLARGGEWSSRTQWSVDHTPRNIYHFPVAAQHDAVRLIWMIRDPRDVVASMMDAARSWASARPGFSIVDASNIWCRAEKAGLRARRALGMRVIPVHYEALSEAPHLVLRRCCEQLGMRYIARDIDAAVRDNQFEKVAKRRGRGQFYRYGMPGTWDRDLSREEAKRIVEITREVASAVGYALKDI